MGNTYTARLGNFARTFNGRYAVHQCTMHILDISNGEVMFQIDKDGTNASALMTLSIADLKEIIKKADEEQWLNG